MKILMGLCISLLLGLQSLAAHADEPAKKNELLFFDSAIFEEQTVFKSCGQCRYIAG